MSLYSCISVSSLVVIVIRLLNGKTDVIKRHQIYVRGKQKTPDLVLNMYASVVNKKPSTGFDLCFVVKH